MQRVVIRNASIFIKVSVSGLALARLRRLEAPARRRIGESASGVPQQRNSGWTIEFTFSLYVSIDLLSTAPLRSALNYGKKKTVEKV